MSERRSEGDHALSDGERTALMQAAHAADKMGCACSQVFAAAESIVRAHVAQALREAADKIGEFQNWYPTSVFPSLDEALSEGYEPTREQVAAQCYRHAYGDLVPRNLRTWAREAIDGPGCDNCGDWDCDCQPPRETDKGMRCAIGEHRLCRFEGTCKCSCHATTPPAQPDGEASA